MRGFKESQGDWRRLHVPASLIPIHRHEARAMALCLIPPPQEQASAHDDACCCLGSSVLVSASFSCMCIHTYTIYTHEAILRQHISYPGLMAYLDPADTAIYIVIFAIRSLNFMGPPDYNQLDHMRILYSALSPHCCEVEVVRFTPREIWILISRRIQDYREGKNRLYGCK